MNSKNKQTEIKAFLSFILEQSKETGLHVSCTIMSEEDTGEGYEIFAGHVSSCKGARLHRLLYGAIAVNENFRKAVTSALLEYERTKTVNRDKMSMNRKVQSVPGTSSFPIHSGLLQSGNFVLSYEVAAYLYNYLLCILMKTKYQG